MRDVPSHVAIVRPSPRHASRQRHMRALPFALLLVGGVTATLAVAANGPDSIGPDAIDHDSTDRASVATGAGYSGSPVVRAVVTQIDQGDFSGAHAAIAAALSDASLLDARALAFQRERMRRIAIDFDQDAAQVRERLRQQIPDLADAEFARWDGQGLLERMDIDGKRLYFNRAASNLFRLSADARARRAEPKPFVESPLQATNAHHGAVVDAARLNDVSSVLPRRMRITQSLTVDADAVPTGEMVSAWIPYPRSIPGQQGDIHLLSSEPATHAVAPESTLQRTVHFEKAAVAGQPTEFSITYDVTVSARHMDVDADNVVAPTMTPGLAQFLAQRPPHIVFTDDLKAFSKRVVGDETNPWRIAQKLFAAVDQIPWAGAREYSTISNISDYALHAGHADCGQQTLLLMTLLRLNGIPARWQSGMMFADNGGVQSYWNLHDWGQLYIAPYGWMPMDVTFGRLDATDPAVAGFYLGGLDGYRVAFNDDYGRPLVPAKRFARSETVDLQRGEAEWSGGNLYFDQWDYDFVATPQPSKTTGERL